MKNCDEMVNSLFKRREEYMAEQRRKRKIITRTIASVCCVCFVFLLSFGILRNAADDKTPTADSPAVFGEEENNYTADYGKTDSDTNPKPSETGTDEPGNYPNNSTSDGNGKKMISSYDAGGFPSASYDTPKNGEFHFSTPLKSAMDEYGDSVLYRVVIHVFRDREQLYSDSSQVKDECERLSGNGYTVAYETIFDGESYRYYFTLHATYEELVSFSADENYGYFMFLYDEIVETTEDDSTAEVYNCGIQ